MSKTAGTKTDLYSWLSSNLGESLLEEQERRMRQLLTGLYGPVAVQLGDQGFGRYINSSASIYHVLAVRQLLTDGVHDAKLMCATSESMPFEPRSVSVLLLPHVLEFSPDPHLVLREASRVLVAEGHLVIAGFNPYSFWGMRRKAGALFGKDQTSPWNGRFFSLARVKDWVAVLGFETISGSWAYYLPPVKSPAVRQRLGFLQKAGERWWPMFAATFVLVVKKRELGMTPIVPGWKKRKRLTPGIVEPVTKNG